MRYIQKTFVAVMLFLLALMILITVSAHFYLDYKFPSDSPAITRKLDSNFIKSRYKVIEARKEGYNDEEISKYLATSFSKERNDSMKNLIIVELAIYVFCILVGSGIILIKNTKEKQNER